MPAQVYQQTGLVKYLSINNTEITVGGSNISLDSNFNVSDIETAAGRIKRFYKKNKKTLKVSYEYLASSSSFTVDGREGRDFIYGLAASSPYVLVSYKDIPNGVSEEFYGFIDSYSDSIIRRDMSTQCIYYNLSFDIMEA